MEETEKKISFTLLLRIIIPYSLCYFMSLLLRNVNVVFATPLTQELHISANGLGFMTGMCLFFFGIFQIPAGSFISHFGTKKVQMSLFFFAAIGICIFGLSKSIFGLTVGRALMGMGTAASLTGTMYTIHSFIPRKYVPTISSIVQALGGLGIIIGTLPIKVLTDKIGWQQTCYVLGGITFLVTLLICIAPKKRYKEPFPKLKQFLDYGTIYKNRLFWRFNIPSSIAYGGFIAIQSLWISPWLQGGQHFSQSESATYLFVIAVVSIFGMMSIPFFISLSRRKNISLQQMQLAFYSVYLIALILSTFDLFAKKMVIWIVMGLGPQAVYFNYIIAGDVFEHSHYVKGVCLNAMNIILGASLIQYLIGFIISFWPRDTQGFYPQRAYQVAFWFLSLITFIAILWSYKFKDVKKAKI
ncbi:MAG: MFS transporter [Rhabdochlamydiaceae bacterium]|nr:MFS transporter [Candidatus Amphrikana amoebophyrae]